MDKVAIEKNIPIPPPGSGKTFKYDFDSLQIGDSLFFGIMKKNLTYTQNQAGSRARAAGRRNGHKYITRRVDESSNGKKKIGVRVWRVA